MGSRLVALASAVLVSLIGFGGSVASAVAIYSYTGNSYNDVGENTPPAGTYTFSMSVTGSITLAAPLPPNQPIMDVSGSVVAFSFEDGRSPTRTQSNSTSYLLHVGTDAFGAIEFWGFFAQGVEPLAVGELRFLVSTERVRFDSGSEDMLDAAIITECVATCIADAGVTRDDPGTWTLIPEPSSALLAYLGLVGLGLSRRRTAAGGPGLSGRGAGDRAAELSRQAPPPGRPGHVAAIRR